MSKFRIGDHVILKKIPESVEWKEFLDGIDEPVGIIHDITRCPSGNYYCDVSLFNNGVHCEYCNVPFNSLRYHYYSDFQDKIEDRIGNE